MSVLLEEDMAPVHSLLSMLRMHCTYAQCIIVICHQGIHKAFVKTITTNSKLRKAIEENPSTPAESFEAFVRAYFWQHLPNTCHLHLLWFSELSITNEDGFQVGLCPTAP